jgi:hypothetical protein
MSKSEPTQRLWLSTSKCLHKHVYHSEVGRKERKEGEGGRREVGRERGRERKEMEGGNEILC